MNCSCIQNEEGMTVAFCRNCAFSLGQRLEDGQPNPDWVRARLGKLTSSKITDAAAKNRQGTGPGVTQLSYRAQLVCERLSGVAYDGFQNSYMERGNATEPDAVDAYQFRVGLRVRSVGFIHHPTIPDAGASPDGLVGDEGQVEVKCRKTHIHFELLNTQQIPIADMNQVLFALACTGRAWCDYVSFDPRAPARCDLFVWRVYRYKNVGRIAELENEGVRFLAEVEKQTRELKERAAGGFIFLNGESDLTKQLSQSLVVAQSKKKAR